MTFAHQAHAAFGRPVTSMTPNLAIVANGEPLSGGVAA